MRFRNIIRNRLRYVESIFPVTGFVLACFLLLMGMLKGVGQVPDSTQSPYLILKNMPPCNDLEVDNEGNLILLDTPGAWIYKYLVETGYDSTIVIGGKGSRSEGFLHPVRISARNRQNIYLLDDVQRRLVVLNTNLKVIDDTDFLSLDQNLDWLSGGEEIYPVSFDASPAGDQFVLNQQNNKVIKINSFGEIENSFGGLDFGEGSLYEPVEVRVRYDNTVLVSDTSQQTIKFYNLYGIYQYTLEPKTNFRWQKFTLYQDYLACFNRDNLYIEHMPSHRRVLIPGLFKNGVADLANGLIDIAFTKDLVCLLFENNEVHLYQVQKYRY